MKLCDYDCGREAKIQFDNGNWCCSKNVHSCSEVRKKIGWLKNRKRGPQSQDHKEKRLKDISGNKNPSKRPEVRKKISESKKGKKLGPHTKEHNKKIGESMKGENNPSKRPEVRKKNSKTNKEKFKDPEFCKKFGKRFLVKPTKPEIFIEEILKDLNLEKYEYVGDFKIWIGGKNPDFINEEDKKIIEFFGWRHTKKATGIPNKNHEKNQLKHFLKYGYKCLVLWDKDLKNTKSLKKRLIRF